jgi:hypothetical protein
VQHEYAHQVDYALFDDALRVHLPTVLRTDLESPENG